MASTAAKLPLPPARCGSFAHPPHLEQTTWRHAGPGSRDAGLATRYDYGGSSSVTDLAGTALTKPSFVNSGGVSGFGAQGVRHWSLRLIATDETRSLTKRHTRPTFLLDPNLSERDGTRGITSHHAGAFAFRIVSCVVVNISNKVIYNFQQSDFLEENSEGLGPSAG